jgi:DNA/RNA-binding domain of Phe-tRNA-synthetase-like protein
MSPLEIEKNGHNLVFDSIVDLATTESVEEYQQALKDFHADEKERIADEVQRMRAHHERFMEDILSGKDDRNFAE